MNRNTTIFLILTFSAVLLGILYVQQHSSTHSFEHAIEEVNHQEQLLRNELKIQYLKAKYSLKDAEYKASRQASDWVDSIKSSMKNAKDWTDDKIRDMRIEYYKNMISTIGYPTMTEGIKEGAKEGYDFAKDKAKQGYDYAKEKAEEGYDFAKDKAQGIKEGAEEGYDYTKDKAKQGYDYAKEKAQGIKEGAKEGYDYAKDKAQETKDRMYDKSIREGERVKEGIASKHAEEAYNQESALKEGIDTMNMEAKKNYNDLKDYVKEKADSMTQNANDIGKNIKENARKKYEEGKEALKEGVQREDDLLE